MSKALQNIKDEIVQERGYKSYQFFEDALTFGREKEVYTAIILIEEVPKRFARLQIEADRERVIEFAQDNYSCIPDRVAHEMKNQPIKLD